MKQHVYNIQTKLIALYVIAIAATTTVSGQNPVANFTASPLSGCSPLIVVFQDQSTGGATSWNWDFGNGNTSTIQNPTATYFTPGTYTVSLTATNVNGSNTLTRNQYITVYEPPTTDFTANNMSGCFPLRVQFQDLSTGGLGNTNVSWQWDLGNGTTSTLQNPLVTYTTAGLFTITLKVTNDKGCIKTLSRPNYISVTPGVKADFTNTLVTVCNPPADITFTNTSTGPPTLSYLWDFGDGNFSAAASPVHTYTTSGSFVATLITTSTAGCEDTMRSLPFNVGGYSTSFTAPANVCINALAVFTNTSTPVPVSSTWDFGDGGTASGTNATHVYPATGTYTVKLYNTYSSCIDSATQTITVNPRAVPNFTAPVRSKCEPSLTVNFQDLSIGANSWLWDFGDGNTSTLQNPVHTYTTYGSFTVSLIVSNAFNCADLLVRPNYINIQRAAISIPALPARGCVPFTIAPVPVIISVDAVTSYDWDFGDGGTSLVANPVHTYAVQGTYTVRLIITTSTGCRDTLLLPGAVRVGSKPAAGFSASPIPVCANQLVQFTDLSVPADEWLWDFGDGGTSALQNPSHRYTDTGYFSVRLIATNNGCPDTLQRISYIRVLPPIARFTSVTNCSNRLQFTFTDQSILPLGWQWDFGDATASALQNPVHIYPALGSYSVRLIVTNGGCADTLIRTVSTVNENPDFSATQTTACKTASITFRASNINAANITNYAWDFGDGGTANVSIIDAVHTYTTSGTYTVTLITTDINGCTNVATKTNYIRINGPTANYTATNLNGCTGLTTTFNDLSTPDGVNAITNWQWDFGDGTIQNFSSPPFQHTYNTTDTFSVQLKITDAAGCMDSLTIPNLVTTTNLVAGFISADTLTCPGATVVFNNTSTPSGFTSQWDFGDGGTSVTASPTHSYAATGSYNVSLQTQDANGCIDFISKNLFVRVDLPDAAFAVNDSVGSCIPLEVQFTNSSTFFSSVLWDFGTGEGTSTLSNPVHYYSTPGSYLVKLLTTSPGGCLDSAFKTITVYDTAGSNVSYLPVNGCKPLSVNLTSFSPGPMNSYYWDFGDGSILITPSPNVTHLYSSFGTFLPKVILEDPSGCLIPLQGINTVVVTGADAKFGSDKNLFCDIGLVNFSDSTTFNDPIASYNWSFGDGATSSQQNPAHQYTVPGNYAVRLIVQTQIGCSDTIIKTNLIKIVQRPLIDIGGDSIICINSSIIHSGIFLQPDTSAVSWFWRFSNGTTSSQQNPPVQTYTTAGTFTITTTATNSTGCIDTTTQTVLVNPLPTATMPGLLTVQAGFPVTIQASYSTNTANWIWSPAAGLSCSNCPAPDADPNFNTLYQVYFTDDNGCSNTASVQVTVICKNANLFVPNTFSPNGDGSNEIFYPRGKGLERVKTLRIFNRWGEVVFEKRDFPVNNAASGWDGTFKGRKPQADVYVYQVEVFCDNGEIIRLNGNIALIL